MAQQSVKTIADNCLDRVPTLSLKEDILGWYGVNSNITQRSIKERLDLIENNSFVRVVTVRFDGALRWGSSVDNVFQEDVDVANQILYDECGVWIYQQDSISPNPPTGLDIDAFDQDDCYMNNHSVSAMEEMMFDVGRSLGADIVAYYINDDLAGFGGCAAHPSGRNGFWIGDSIQEYAFAHELGHCLGLVHTSDTDRLMYDGYLGNITNPPPDLLSSECTTISGAPELEQC